MMEKSTELAKQLMEKDYETLSDDEKEIVTLYKIYLKIEELKNLNDVRTAIKIIEKIKEVKA